MTNLFPWDSLEIYKSDHTKSWMQENIHFMVDKEGPFHQFQYQPSGTGDNLSPEK